MTERIELIRELRAAATNRRRQVRLFFWFSAISGPISLYFGTMLYFESGSVLLGLVEIATGLIIGLNALAFALHGRLRSAQFILTVAVLTTLCATLIVGGVGGTGIYWWFMYSSAALFLLGRKAGMAMNAVAVVASVVIYALGRMGAFEPYFTFIEFRQMWVVVVVIAVLAYLREKEREDALAQSSAQRQRLRVILENMPAGVLLFSAPEGIPIGTNSVAERLLGCDVDPDSDLRTFPGAHGLRRQDGSPYPPEDFPVMDAIRTGIQTVRADVFVERKDGQRSVLRVSAAPVRDKAGTIVSAVAVLEDATREHEIDMMKSEFVALAGHQLKTPITGIKWSVESLLGGDAGSLGPEQRAHVMRIEEIAERIDRLVADLLSVSHIETGRKFDLTSVPTDATAMIERVIEEVRPLAEKRGIELRSGLPARLQVFGDETKLREVFMNLLSNAIKYGKERGVVAVGAHRLTEDEAILYVKDDGIGIPEEQRRRVFEKFFRAGNVPEESEGTGLGLYIARAIVEKHRGRLWFESEEGKGTTFFVALPRRGPEGAAEGKNGGG